MRKTIIFSVLILTSIFSYSQDKITNQSILDLIDLGFESEVIKAKINSSPSNFDTSMNQLKSLKEKGVSPDILALMIDKSKAVIENGVFFYRKDDLIKIEPSVFSGTRTSALGAGLTSGIAAAKIKSYVNNSNSSNKVDSSNLSFIFQFDTQNKNDLGSGNWWFKTASSPNEFALTELKQKKNRRELVTGKVRAITASTQMGIDSKNTIEFSIEDLGDGRYKVTPKEKLKPGEYCFFYQGTVPMGGYNNQSIFDFSVQ
ncbi:hypothetical protein SAMN04487911_1047 [Arenibacter nanhaiticus]|uniref:Uncharacterized protein n=1 Tax=Arenibacter nanhaiticus TaxID=558155 RepID=A0A1M6CPP3_9FLAO|nr:hypothetical protein [Arenibacter nanhaiticus]SHI62811.1 hypothetical protein SAMN04487911_1047 [Arenibacter nanhaiticus]